MVGGLGESLDRARSAAAALGPRSLVDKADSTDNYIRGKVKHVAGQNLCIWMAQKVDFNCAGQGECSCRQN